MSSIRRSKTALRAQRDHHVAVNDDTPFLYDSCTAEIRAQGLRIAAAFHPSSRSRAMVRAARAGRIAAQGSIIVLALEEPLDAAQAENLRAGLLGVFADVRSVVRDWRPMMARLAETTSGLQSNPPPIPETELAEAIAFLDWLKDNHFTSSLPRYVFSPEGEGRLEALNPSGLGLLADPEMRVVRRGSDRSSLTPEVREFLTQPAPLIIAKSALRSPVHRRVHMDYVGVKTSMRKAS